MSKLRTRALRDYVRSNYSITNVRSRKAFPPTEAGEIEIKLAGG